MLIYIIVAERYECCLFLPTSDHTKKSVIFDGDQRFNCSQNPVDQGRLSLVQPDCVALLGRGLAPAGFRRTVLTSGASPSRRLRNYSF